MLSYIDVPTELLSSVKPPGAWLRVISSRHTYIDGVNGEDISPISLIRNKKENQLFSGYRHLALYAYAANYVG